MKCGKRKNNESINIVIKDVFVRDFKVNTEQIEEDIFRMRNGIRYIGIGWRIDG